jgi:hypothetical protein
VGVLQLLCNHGYVQASAVGRPVMYSVLRRGRDGSHAFDSCSALLTGLMVRVATLIWPRYEWASCCPRKVEQPALLGPLSCLLRHSAYYFS